MPELRPALTFGPGLVDWQDRIDVGRLRRHRIERMQAVMRSNGVAALLASGTDDCRYLTGLTGADFSPQLWYVLFFADSEPIVFAHAGWSVQQPREVSWIREFRVARSWLSGICGPEAAEEEAAKFAGEVVAELRSRGVAGESLAIIGMDERAQNALRGQGVTLRGGAALMLEATAIKSADEVACIQMACAIAESAWFKCLPALRPGVTEDELSHLAIAAAYAAGAENARAGFRSGPLTFERGMKGAGRLIQAEEPLYGNLCGTSFLGYRCCLYRTFVAGAKPAPQLRDWYARLVERLDKVMDAIRPGATTADAALHFPPAGTWGYADEASVLTIEIGHGCGLHQYELPVINRQWSLDHPQVFEPGMVVAVEGREGDFGRGGVRLENMVVVTPSGCEILDRFPREEIVAVPYV